MNACVPFPTLDLVAPQLYNKGSWCLEKYKYQHNKSMGIQGKYAAYEVISPSTATQK